jgi:hypothetical protein
MKHKTLREKIVCSKYFGGSLDSLSLDYILRLIRDEQKRKCGECIWNKEPRPQDDFTENK